MVHKRRQDSGRHEVPPIDVAINLHIEFRGGGDVEGVGQKLFLCDQMPLECFLSRGLGFRV